LIGFEQAFDCNDFVTILKNAQNTFTLLYKEDIVLYIGIEDLEETEAEMNTGTSKGSVRNDFKHVRDLMRQAEALMGKQNRNWNQEEAEEIANELIAAVTTFSQYVEEHQQYEVGNI